jgi:HEPN domain-containing protein
VVVRQAPNFDLVCYLAQQCAEKYLKARLVEAGLPFRKTHDLEELLHDVLPLEPTWNALLTDLQFLTSFAVDVRYPGMDATQVDAQDAVACGQRVRQVIRLSFGLHI